MVAGADGVSGGLSVGISVTADGWVAGVLCRRMHAAANVGDASKAVRNAARLLSLVCKNRFCGRMSSLGLTQQRHIWAQCVSPDHSWPNNQISQLCLFWQGWFWVRASCHDQTSPQDTAYLFCPGFHPMSLQSSGLGRCAAGSALLCCLASNQ